MTIPTTVENYFEQLDLEQLFKTLGATDPKALVKTIYHFTTKEAGKRDRIVLTYFGQSGIDQIVDSIVTALQTSPELPKDSRILDLGAGSGFFTVRIAEKVRQTNMGASFYAMDLTPAMLLSLARSKEEITSFVGLAENIKGSVQQARKFLKIPLKFDVVFSTLMLHHSPQPARVFESIKEVLKKNGKVVILDLCEHEFEEFRTEMGDLHLGFKTKDIRYMARRHFSTVRIEKMKGIFCSSSGRSAEIFLAVIQNRR
jgi:ArsR family transcriptional regulator